MLNIEIKGVQFSNKGAELMLIAILEQLDEHLDDYQITLSPGQFLPYLNRAKLGAWQKLSFRRSHFDLTGLFGKLPKKLLALFRRYGIVTEAEIDVILDASGFAYGEQWGTRSLKHTLNEIVRFKKSGKKYIFLPQAFGPFEKENYKKLAREIFSQADLVFPRDEKSYHAIISCDDKLSQKPQIKLSPDFTCLVQPHPFIDRTRSSQACETETSVVNKPTICLIPNNKMVSKFHHQNANKDQKPYIEFFITVGKYYKKNGWQVVLLNHEGKEDKQLCNQIAQELSSDETILILNDLSALDIKAYIGSVDAVISSRFHGCVSALTQGTPCLATSWSHKYQMLFSEYGLAENVIDFKMADTLLINQLDEFNESLVHQKVLSIAHAKIVKEQSRHMWKQVFSILSSENIDNSKPSC